MVLFFGYSWGGVFTAFGVGGINSEYQIRSFPFFLLATLHHSKRYFFLYIHLFLSNSGAVLLSFMSSFLWKNGTYFLCFQNDIQNIPLRIFTPCQLFGIHTGSLSSLWLLDLFYPATLFEEGFYFIFFVPFKKFYGGSFLLFQKDLSIHRNQKLTNRNQNKFPSVNEHICFLLLELLNLLVRFQPRQHVKEKLCPKQVKQPARRRTRLSEKVIGTTIAN